MRDSLTNAVASNSLEDRYGKLDANGFFAGVSGKMLDALVENSFSEKPGIARTNQEQLAGVMLGRTISLEDLNKTVNLKAIICAMAKREYFMHIARFIYDTADEDKIKELNSKQFELCEKEKAESTENYIFPRINVDELSDDEYKHLVKHVRLLLVQIAKPDIRQFLILDATMKLLLTKAKISEEKYLTFCITLAQLKLKVDRVEEIFKMKEEKKEKIEMNNELQDILMLIEMPRFKTLYKVALQCFAINGLMINEVPRKIIVEFAKILQMRFQDAIAIREEEAIKVILSFQGVIFFDKNKKYQLNETKIKDVLARQQGGVLQVHSLTRNKRFSTTVPQTSLGSSSSLTPNHK